MLVLFFIVRNWITIYSSTNNTVLLWSIHSWILWWSPTDLCITIALFHLRILLWKELCHHSWTWTDTILINDDILAQNNKLLGWRRLSFRCQVHFRNFPFQKQVVCRRHDIIVMQTWFWVCMLQRFLWDDLIVHSWLRWLIRW